MDVAPTRCSAQNAPVGRRSRVTFQSRRFRRSTNSWNSVKGIALAVVFPGRPFRMSLLSSLAIIASTRVVWDRLVQPSGLPMVPPCTGSTNPDDAGIVVSATDHRPSVYGVLSATIWESVRSKRTTSTKSLCVRRSTEQCGSGRSLQYSQEVHQCQVELYALLWAFAFLSLHRLNAFTCQMPNYNSQHYVSKTKQFITGVYCSA